MTRTIVALLAIASLLGADGSNKITNYMEGRTTMVHLFEWKWNDIARECEEFLGPMGYGGIQVSPITENVAIGNRPWYERYQPISYEWSTRSGNEEEFRHMTRRCNAAGVRIYVDAVFNHMSGDHENAIGTGGSKANTYEYFYPRVPYNRSDFHSPVCDIYNYMDPFNVRNCELVGLHDLDQSLEHVRDMIVAMMNKAIDAGVAGFRIDAAKHMWPEDLQVIYSRLNDLNVEHGFPQNSRPFIYQEVIDYNGNEGVKKSEYTPFGAVTEFKYGYELSHAFLGRNMLKWFVTFGEPWGLLPRNDALVFIDNHDTQRNNADNPITYKNSKLYKMAVAFMLAHPYGTPKLMSSFAFDHSDQGPPADGKGDIVSPVINEDNSCGKGWVCEHRWRQIYNMVAFRNYVFGERNNITSWWDNGSNQISFCRGNKGFVAFNADSYDLKQRLNVCMPAGVYCDVISGELKDGKCTGKSVSVDAMGEADVTIGVGEYDGVLAIHGGAKLQ